MKSWKNWLFPILTCLTVLGMAWLPLRLSLLEDQKLSGVIHSEDLAADCNFPAKPPDLLGRIWLLAQWYEYPDTLTVVGQDLESSDELNEISSRIREELTKLVEDKLLPKEVLEFPDTFSVSRYYLRDQTDLSNARFLRLYTYDKLTNSTLSLALDEEDGHILAIRLNLSAPSTELLPWDIGKTFLDRLGLESELLNASGTLALYRLPGSRCLYEMMSYASYLEITPHIDWSAIDDAEAPLRTGTMVSDA